MAKFREPDDWEALRAAVNAKHYAELALVYVERVCHVPISAANDAARSSYHSFLAARCAGAFQG
jgi:hypothetical protein